MGKFICIHLKRFSQIIKDVTGSKNNYIDTYYFCSEMKKRITKKTCNKCKLYKPLIHG